MSEKLTLTHAELAKEILEAVGGQENVVSYMSCMTRLRIECVDKSKIDAEKIKKLDKVKGCQVSGSIAQVILFNELEKTYKEFEKICIASGSAAKAKRSILDLILNFCSSVFTPVIPAMIACGLIQGVVTSLTSLNIVTADSSTVKLLSIVGNLALYFFPVLLAYSASKYLKTNPFITILIALLMVSPDFAALVNDTVASGSNYIKFLGFIPLRATSYTSTSFPMLCAVWGEMFVERLVYKYIPDTIKPALAPPIVIFLSIPICLGILAPAGAFLADGFGVVFQAIYDNVPIVAGLILGATATLMVFLGIHMINIVIAMNNFAMLGYDVIWPVLCFSNVIAGIVALTCGLRVKNKEEKSQSIAAGLTSALIGISEPAVYGTIFRDKKAILSMIITGAIVGTTSFVIGTHALYLAQGPILLTIPAYAETPVQFFVTFALCFLAIPITWILGGGKELDK